ncbi:MAG: VRR-NUC domain-containing protein [Rikenellaceae bacterium]
MSRHLESKLQIACVTWFRMQYRSLEKVLFAVPNGGARSKIEAKIMKAEGVTPGVADLILLKANSRYGALCIEMKTKSNRSTQSDNQLLWQEEITQHGSKYVVCRSLDEFMNEVNNYLKS